jgi:hypothetical protein
MDVIHAGDTETNLLSERIYIGAPSVFDFEQTERPKSHPR